MWRLKRLLRIRYEYAQETNTRGIRMLDLCIVTAFADCVDAGDRERALMILEVWRDVEARTVERLQRLAAL